MFIFVLMRTLLYFFCGLALTACGASTDAGTKTDSTALQQVVPKGTFETGKILRMTCAADTSNHYALYLPKAYTPTKSWPILILFDPHAAGDLPLTKYQSLAEKHNLVLAGSFNSKNGMDAATTTKIGNTLLGDVQQKLALDSSRLFIGGFSGGARVAGTVAMANTQFDAVVGCSASLSAPQTMPAFAYIGIAGRGDMNCLEMIQQENALSSTPLQHALLLFDGKHNWPPEATMADAFDVLDCFRGDAATRTKTSATFTAAQIALADPLINSDPLQAEAYLKTAFAANTNVNDSTAKTKLLALYNSAAWKTANAHATAVQTKESQMQQEFTNHIATADLSWWKMELAQIDTLHEKDKETRQMHQRLYGYISLMAYSYSNRMIQVNDLTTAQRCTELYRFVDPTNSEAYYFSAIVAAKQNDSTNMISYLQSAVKNGFDDKNRIEHESAFAGYLNDAQFRTITGGMK